MHNFWGNTVFVLGLLVRWGATLTGEAQHGTQVALMYSGQKCARGPLHVHPLGWAIVQIVFSPAIRCCATDEAPPGVQVR